MLQVPSGSATGRGNRGAGRLAVERLAYDHGAALAQNRQPDTPCLDVLLAAGRVPNVERSVRYRRVEVSRRGIIVDALMAHERPGIWRPRRGQGPQFTRSRLPRPDRVDDMFGSTGSTADYSMLRTAIFTDPNSPGFGLTERRRATGVRGRNGSIRFVRYAAYSRIRCMACSGCLRRLLAPKCWASTS